MHSWSGARGLALDRDTVEQPPVDVDEEPSAFHVRAERKFVRETVVAERSVLAERGEPAVHEPPDLKAAGAACGAEDQHPPERPAVRVRNRDRK